MCVTYLHPQFPVGLLVVDPGPFLALDLVAELNEAVAVTRSATPESRQFASHPSLMTSGVTGIVRCRCINHVWRRTADEAGRLSIPR